MEILVFNHISLGHCRPSIPYLKASIRTKNVNLMKQGTITKKLKKLKNQHKTKLYVVVCFANTVE